MLKLIRFCAVWIKIRILLLLFDNRAFFCTFCDKHSFCGTSKCSSIREEDTNFLQKKKKINIFEVPILIQTCVTVTQCTLLYHLYIMLVRKKQKEIEDYIFSIDPKMWWPINIVHPRLVSSTLDTSCPFRFDF